MKNEKPESKYEIVKDGERCFNGEEFNQSRPNTSPAQKSMQNIMGSPIFPAKTPEEVASDMRSVYARTAFTVDPKKLDNMKTLASLEAQIPMPYKMAHVSEEILRRLMIQFREDSWTGNYIRTNYDMKEAGKRTRDALEALRSKGYCREKRIDEVCDKLFKEYDTITGIYSSIFMYNDELLKTKALNTWFVKNRDRVWVQAIEKAMYACERRRFTALPPKPFHVEDCIKHIDEIYGNAIQIVYHMALKNACAELKEEQLSAKERKEFENEVKAAKAEVAESEKKQEQIKKKLEKEIEEKNKRIRKLEKMLLEKESENRRLIEVFDAFEEANITEEDESVLEDFDIEKVEVSLADKYKDVVVPEDRSVIFLGGAPQFISKIRSLHPNWRYISDYERENLRIAQSANSKISCIILYSKHISHSTALNVINAAGSDTPIIYLNSINMSLVEETIKQGFAKIAEEAKNEKEK